jgi:hypothetical protein
MAPAVPPIWSIAVMSAACASDAPVARISVGIQFDRRYTTSRLMKNDSQSNSVPIRSPPSNNWSTGDSRCLPAASRYCADSGSVRQSTGASAIGNRPPPANSGRQP